MSPYKISTVNIHAPLKKASGREKTKIKTLAYSCFD